MQKAKVGAMVGLLGLGLTGGAQAWSPFGQGEAPTSSEGKAASLGFGKLDSARFPSFQNFRFDSAGSNLNGAPGMVYRTQQHLLAQRAGHGDSFSVLGSRKDLGEMREGLAKKQLQAVMANDAATHWVSTSGYSAFQDLEQSLRSRLLGAARRSLLLAIESPNHLRRRYVLVYNAEERGDVLVCDVYDPHVDPRSFGSQRFFKLYLHGAYEQAFVSHAWIDHLNKEKGAPERWAAQTTQITVGEDLSGRISALPLPQILTTGVGFALTFTGYRNVGRENWNLGYQVVRWLEDAAGYSTSTQDQSRYEHGVFDTVSDFAATE